MFVDELTIHARAGTGGDGVVRWHREKFKPRSGPAGGNGGNGGSVFVRAVRDIGLLSKYTGVPLFAAEDGEPGRDRSQYGRNGEDLVIDVPVGSIVTNVATKERYELLEEGSTKKVLAGGQGGLGNEYFKSSTNRSPEEATRGKSGEEAGLHIELELVVDVGFIGLPNAGKSSLINALTNARSKIGAYPFTTLSPYLGSFHGYVLADIPGLIAGASEGKGLGHQFLKHIRRTKMLLHAVSCESPSPYKDWKTVRDELSAFDPSLIAKREIVVLTKSDTVTEEELQSIQDSFGGEADVVATTSIYDDESLKKLSDALTASLSREGNSATL